MAYGDKIFMHGLYAGFEGHYNHTCEGGRLSHYECVEGYAPGNRTSVDAPSLEADLPADSRHGSMAYQGGLSANLARYESTSPGSPGGVIRVESNDAWAPGVGWTSPHASGDGYGEQTIPVQDGVTAMAFEPHSAAGDSWLRLMVGTSAREVPPGRRLEAGVPSARVEVYGSYNYRDEMEKEAGIDLMEGSTAVTSIDYSPDAELVAIAISLDGGRSGLQLFEKGLGRPVREWTFEADADAPFSAWMPPTPVVSWSPDGSRLAIARPDTGRVDVYGPLDGRDWTGDIDAVASLEAGLMFPSDGGALTYDIEVNPAKAVAFHGDGSALYVAHDSDVLNSTVPAEVRVYSTETWGMIDKYSSFDFVDSFKSLKFRPVRSRLDDCCLGITEFKYVEEDVRHQLAMSVSKTGLPDFVAVFEVEPGPTSAPTLQPSASPSTAAQAPFRDDDNASKNTACGQKIRLYSALAMFTFICCQLLASF